jgi:hypothetical protein
MSAAGWARRSAPEWVRAALAPVRRWRAQRPTQTARGAPGRQLLPGPGRRWSWVPLRSTTTSWTGVRAEWWLARGQLTAQTRQLLLESFELPTVCGGGLLHRAEGGGVRGDRRPDHR